MGRKDKADLKALLRASHGGGGHHAGGLVSRPEHVGGGAKQEVNGERERRGRQRLTRTADPSLVHKETIPPSTCLRRRGIAAKSLTAASDAFLPVAGCIFRTARPKCTTAAAAAGTCNLVCEQLSNVFFFFLTVREEGGSFK